MAGGPRGPRNARSLSAEMHSGFAAMRTAMPMNLRRAPVKLEPTAAVADDLARITTILRDCRQRHGKGGPFLFGRFTVADAMYAPVVTRLRTYRVDVEPVIAEYMNAIESHPSMREWTEAARNGPYTIPVYNQVGL